MTPRPEPTGVGAGPAREPTQSIQLALPEDDIGRLPQHLAHPSIALGTHDHPGDDDDDPWGLPREERTKVESPNARVRTPVPARQPSQHSRPPPVPRGDGELDHIGSVLGSYKVVELLGKGGMGYVFRAEHVKLGREVALKLLRGDYAKRRDAVFRFFQEAKTVNKIRHRNIVDVTDFVELPDGTTFIIMELLTGQSLGRWARTGIDLPRALAVLVQICDGLAAAHHVDVVHRDLKPDNIIVVPTGDGGELVKLLDFGVAKLLNRDDEDVGFQTAAGSVIGTPAYMSPEQAGGMPVDARSDTYSLGAIMYELFCGQPMFRGRSFGEFVRKHLTEMPVPPRATPAGAHMDPRLEALIMRCLQKEPSQRFSHIGELRDALLGFLGSMHGETGMLQMPPPQPSRSWDGGDGSPIATLTGSAVHPMATGSSQVSHHSLAPLPLPAQTILAAPQQPMYAPPLGSQPVAMHAFLPPLGQTPNGGYAQQGYGTHPGAMQAGGYATYGSQIVPPTGIQVTTTPWWLWFVGGAAAVGLGIGAAVWYAHSSAPAPAIVTPAPIALVDHTAIAEPLIPPPQVRPAPLEVKFDSLPSGSVFAAGRSAELCKTPCTFVIDPADGNSPEARTFLVRAAGYHDYPLQVDLRGTQRVFSATLVQDEPEPQVLTPVPVLETPAQLDKPDSGTKKHGRDKKPKPTPTVTTPTTSPTPANTGTTGSDPGPKKHGKRHGIDPTETIDPFAK